MTARVTILAIGLAGLVLFGLPLAFTYLSPIHVERAARSFIQTRIEHQIRDELGLGAEGPRHVGRLAEALSNRHKAEIGELRERLADVLSDQVARGVARMQNANCECRELMRQWLYGATQSRISSLQRAEPQLHQIIEGKYGVIVSNLLRDFRTFLGINLLAFALLLMVAITKPSRTRQLLVPAILLAAAGFAATTVYLFGQNWFFTILYGDFIGWGYGVWLALIFGFLCDIVLFKARVTTRVADTFSSAITPC